MYFSLVAVGDLVDKYANKLSEVFRGMLSGVTEGQHKTRLFTSPSCLSLAEIPHLDNILEKVNNNTLTYVSFRNYLPCFIYPVFARISSKTIC